MIVSEEDVSTALAYLAEDPHPIAIAKYDLATAANEVEELYAELYLDAEGTVSERDSRVRLDPAYKQLKAGEAAAAREVERHRARMIWADKLIETWRSENANVRAAERVR